MPEFPLPGPTHNGYERLFVGYAMNTGHHDANLTAESGAPTYYTDLIDVVGYPKKLNAPLIDATEEGRIGFAMPAIDSLHYLPNEEVFVSSSGFVMDRGIQPATVISPDIEGSIIRRISPDFDDIDYFDYLRDNDARGYNAKSQTPVLAQGAGINVIPQIDPTDKRGLARAVMQAGLVTKPNYGTSGGGVKFYRRGNLPGVLYNSMRGNLEGHVAEQRIKPRPIELDGSDNDWNIRSVLNNGEFIHAYARFDSMGSAVNVGKGAKRMSMESLSSQPGFNQINIQEAVIEASEAAGTFMPRGRALLDFIFSEDWDMYLMEAGTGYIFPTLGDASTFDDPVAVHDRLVNSYQSRISSPRHDELREKQDITVGDLDWDNAVNVISRPQIYDYLATNMEITEGAIRGGDGQELIDMMRASFSKLVGDVQSGNFVTLTPGESNERDVTRTCSAMLSAIQGNLDTFPGAAELQEDIINYVNEMSEPQL